MSEFKGTKGKWVYDDEDVFSLNKEENKVEYFICTNPKPYSDDRHIWEANALLISKAPEMLEMLEELVKELSFHGYNNSKAIYDAKQLIKEATDL